MTDTAERADLGLFRDHCHDMFSDFPKYLRAAAKEAPCLHCAGTGEVQLPRDDVGQTRMILSAFVQSIGGSSTVPIAGERCGWCDGSGVDEKKQQDIASAAFAQDWFPTMQELFP